MLTALLTVNSAQEASVSFQMIQTVFSGVFGCLAATAIACAIRGRTWRVWRLFPTLGRRAGAIGFGCLISIVGMVVLVRNEMNYYAHGRRMEAPVTAKVTFDEVGDHLVFLVTDSTRKRMDAGATAPKPEQIEVTVAPVDPRPALEITRVQGYSLDLEGEGRVGESVCRFQVADPGAYQISITSNKTSGDPHFSIYIYANMTRHILMGIPILIGTVVASVLPALFFLKRPSVPSGGPAVESPR